MANEGELPNLTPTHSIKAYGATGDGVTDDTQAFLAAIADMPKTGAVLHIPAGRCV
jgi:polygalacturonase